MHVPIVSDGGSRDGAIVDVIMSEGKCLVVYGREQSLAKRQCVDQISRTLELAHRFFFFSDWMAHVGKAVFSQQPQHQKR